jgi:hypothetical protein
MSLDALPEQLSEQRPVGGFRISKSAVGLYLVVIVVLVGYMLWVAGRLNVSSSASCGEYNFSTVAHAEPVYAWAFTHPYGNVSQHIAAYCAQLRGSYDAELPALPSGNYSAQEVP